MTLTPDEKRLRAEHARRLLDDPLLKEALDEIDAGAIRQFREAAPDDVDALRYAALRLWGAEEFRRVFTEIINDALLAEKRQ